LLSKEKKQRRPLKRKGLNKRPKKLDNKQLKKNLRLRKRKLSRKLSMKKGVLREKSMRKTLLFKRQRLLSSHNKKPSKSPQPKAKSLMLKMQPKQPKKLYF
jgi:hypothetical protein